MNKLYIISFCNLHNNYDKTKYLIESADKYNMKVEFIGIDIKIEDFKLKDKIYEFFKKISEFISKNINGIVLLVDAFDIFILDFEENIINEFLNLNCDILYSVERHYCHQVIGENREIINYYYKKVDNTDYRFLNSGCCIGYINSLYIFFKDLINFYEDKYNLIPLANINKENDDQAMIGYFIYVSNGFISYNIKFDYYCKIFLNPYEYLNINESKEIHEYLLQEKNYEILKFNNKIVKSKIIHLSNISSRLYLANYLLDLILH